MLKRTILAAAAAIPFIVGTASAQQAAEPLPRSGEFSLTFTFVNPEAWAPIARAVDATGAVTETAVIGTNVAWLMNNDGGAFAQYMTGRCGTLTRFQGATIVFAEGNCVYTDKDGDMLFESFERLQGNDFNTGHWTGGTGKYAGITSTFEIRGIPGFPGRTEGQPVANGVPGLNELYGMSAGIKTGTYTLPPL